MKLRLTLTKKGVSFDPKHFEFNTKNDKTSNIIGLVR